MSCRKGLTSWVIAAGRWSIAYRWNMDLWEAARTFHVIHGPKTVLACGPLIFEW
jgi:hypothetical protein